MDGDRSDFNDEAPAMADRLIRTRRHSNTSSGGEGELASQPASQPAEIVFLSAGLPPVLLVSYLKIERRIEGNM